MKSNRIAFAASTLLLFVAPGVLAATDPAPAAAPQESLPDAKTLIEKHIEAIGGREKLKQVKCRSSSSTIEVPAAGVKGTTKVYHLDERDLQHREIGCTQGDCAATENGELKPPARRS